MTLPRSVSHHREWLDAIKSRAECSCSFAYGHRLTTVGHLGNIALDRRDAQVGRHGRTDHESPRGEPAADQGISPALEIA